MRGGRGTAGLGREAAVEAVVEPGHKAAHCEEGDPAVVKLGEQLTCNRKPQE